MTNELQGQIGPEAKYDMRFEGLDLVASVTYQGKDASSQVTLRLNGRAVLEALKNAIPGKYDDIIINMIEDLVPAQVEAPKQ